MYDDTAVRDLLTLATEEHPEVNALWTHAELAARMGDLNWGVTASWVSRTLAGLRLKVHQIRGWLHRRPDPDFATKVAAVQSVIAGAADDPYPVLSLDEKTAFSVRTPICPDTGDRHGRTRREFEYQRRGTISWYGVQDVATGRVDMRRATARMDSVAFTALLGELIKQHGPIFTLVVDNGPAHTSRHTTAWLAEHPGITVVYTPVHASWVGLPRFAGHGDCVAQATAKSTRAARRSNSSGLRYSRLECRRRGLYQPSTQSKIAACTSARVGQDCRWMSSALMVAKNDSATALSQH